MQKSKQIEGWKEVKLGDIAECLDGDWILSENMSNEGEMGIVQLKHIGEGYFLDKGFNFITNETCNKLGCTVLETGDLLVSRMAEPICRSCILPKLKFKAVTAVDVAIIRSNNKIVDKNFLNLIFNSSIVKEQAAQYASGTTRLRISRKNLEKLKIPLPSLSIQKQIVLTLDKAEKLKEKREEADELTKEYLQSIFADMFYNKKFDEAKLGDICKFIDYRGKTPNKTEFGIPLITAKNVKEGYISKEPEEFISEKDYLPWMRRGFPKEGDVLFTTEAPLGNVALLGKFDKIALAQRIITFQCNKNINSYYLLFVMLSPLIKDRLKQQSTGSTAIGIRSKELKQIQIPIPPIELQQKFSSIVKQVEILKEKQKQSKDEINIMFDSLMKQAFNGELIK